MTKTRILGFCFLLFIISLLLTGRLAQLGIMERPQLLQRANSIRTTQINLSTERGDILDRNGISFTNVDNQATVVIEPKVFRTNGGDNKDTISFLSKVLNQDASMLRSRLTKMNSIANYSIKSEDAVLIKNRAIKGISIFYSKKRYGESNIAAHLLGYLDGTQTSGVAGIENHLDYLLKGGSSQSIGVTQNAKNETLHGLGVNLFEDKSECASIKTTLDFYIQDVLEKSLNQQVVANPNFKGAVVIGDVKDGSIVAMSSRPTYNRNKIENYLNDPAKPLINRATLPYSLGSVFKIVDTAAWLENNEQDPPVDFCSGKIEVAGRTILCNNLDGHKYLALDRAFESSCNPFYISMSKLLGYEKILKMASLLGLGKKTGLVDQGIDESAGSLPLGTDFYNEGDLANMALGQGKVAATPVQVLGIINAVVNNGNYTKPWILNNILDSDGKVISKFHQNSNLNVFSQSTADRLKRLMIGTVDHGTGTLVKLPGGAGGKTGSAESGNGLPTHAWFAGFFPAEQPRYSIVVIVENGGHGGKIAGPIFMDIAQKIIDMKLLK